MPTDNFLILDTEGKDILSELALIDAHGNLLYEGFVKDHHKNYGIRLNCKTLHEILQDFLKVSAGKILICHFAEHDTEVLHNSFKHSNLSWKPPQIQCTYLMTKRQYPNLQSYALDYLSKHFDLTVQNKRFNIRQAHRARYDALFTYQLYRKLTESQIMTPESQNNINELNIQPTEIETKISNPFATNRVDTPFQV